MEGVKEKQGQLVFGLDIGTRSIVGTELCWMVRFMISAKPERRFLR